MADRGTAPAQQSLQLILARNLISTLSTPAFIVDPDATVVFYNDAAGDLLGLHYEETGKVALDDWRLPLKDELCGRRPVHTTAGVTTAGDVECEVEVLALPLIGPDDEHEGAVGVFWPREGTPR